jgi:hypothetical protein
VWAWRRGDSVVALNLTDERATLRGTRVIALSTTRSRDGDAVSSGLDLAPYEAVVMSAAV